MKPPRPNLLLIMADQWRGDCLGCAGHPVVETPHLDELFHRGVRFDHAYSAVPTCIAALMTGLSQHSHGRMGYADNVPWDYEVTLPGRSLPPATAPLWAPPARFW